MKKEYMKPEQRVVELQHRTMLLSGSLNSVGSNLDTEDEIGISDEPGSSGADNKPQASAGSCVPAVASGKAEHDSRTGHNERKRIMIIRNRTTKAERVDALDISKNSRRFNWFLCEKPLVSS